MTSAPACLGPLFFMDRRMSRGLGAVGASTPPGVLAKDCEHLQLPSGNGDDDLDTVVTNIEPGTAEWLYDSLYCARGQAEI